MSHFSNLAIDEMNKQKGDKMFGGKENKPATGDEKYAGMEPGVYAVSLDDMVTGVSDKSGKQYWIMKLLNDKQIQFDHFMPCEADQFKTEEKVYDKVARQMDALLIYDAIGQHDTLEAYIQKAIDVAYQLKGKKIEFTIKKWSMDGKSGVWGEITGFLDIPNDAIQTAKNAGATKDDDLGFDKNEELGF